MPATYCSGVLVWGPQPSGSRTWWIQNRTANCLVHLRDCDLQDIQVRTEAEARHRPPPHQRRRSPDQGDTVFGDRASPVNEGHGPSSITAVAEQHPSGHLPYNDPSVSSSPQLQATATIPPIYHSVAHHARELGTYSIPPGLQAWMPDWNTLVAPTDYPDAAHLARQQGWAGPARASGEVLAAAVPHDESVMVRRHILLCEHCHSYVLLLLKMRETAPPQAGPSVRSSALAPLPEDPTHVWYDNGSYPWHGSHGGS